MVSFNLCELLSCIFLGIALKKIYSSIENSKFRRVAQVDIKLIAWHASAYLLAYFAGIATAVAYYASGDGRGYIIMEIILNFLVSIS